MRCSAFCESSFIRRFRFPRLASTPDILSPEGNNRLDCKNMLPTVGHSTQFNSTICEVPVEKWNPHWNSFSTNTHPNSDIHTQSIRMTPRHRVTTYTKQEELGLSATFSIYVIVWTRLIQSHHQRVHSFLGLIMLKQLATSSYRVRSFVFLAEPPTACDSDVLHTIAIQCDVCIK